MNALFSEKLFYLCFYCPSEKNKNKNGRSTIFCMNLGGNNTLSSLLTNFQELLFHAMTVG